MPDRERVERVKAAADIERIADVLGLHRTGARYFCPSCQPTGGTSPDLALYSATNSFCCFKCGSKGDVIALVMLARSVDFKAALSWLEGETGTGSRSSAVAAKSRPTPSVTPTPSTIAPCRATSSEIYSAFLAACRPVEGVALDWLTKERGIAPEVVEAMGLRFCGRDFPEAMATLQNRFPEDDLIAAGMMKKKPTGFAYAPLWRYYQHRVGFLVIPYILDGVPVYLKMRPPIGKDRAAELDVPRFMNTGGTIPCLYNVDALKAAGRIYVCEGESDTWAALSTGFAAVGSPGARAFKSEWVELFRGHQRDGDSTVYLVPDRDKAGTEGAQLIAGLFVKAGLPPPFVIELPEGVKDLAEFMKGGMPE